MDAGALSGEEEGDDPPPLTNTESDRTESQAPLLPSGNEIKAPEVGEVYYAAIEEESGKDVNEKEKENSLLVLVPVTEESQIENEVTVESQIPYKVTVESQIENEVTAESQIPYKVTVDSQIENEVTAESQIANEVTEVGKMDIVVVEATPQSLETSAITTEEEMEDDSEVTEMVGLFDVMKESLSPCQENRQEEDRSIAHASCQVQAITLGEYEREQLKTAGQHILEIGQQLLEEMNFVETVLAKFGFVRKSDGAIIQSNRPSLQGNDGTQMELTQSSSENEGATKSQITAQEQLCLLGSEQSPNKENNGKDAEIAAKFGSGSGSITNLLQTLDPIDPNQGTSLSDGPNIPNVTDTTGVTDLQKRLAVLEIQMEEMNSKLVSCEKQVKDTYNAMCQALKGLSEQTASLRVQFGNESKQSVMLRTAIGERISNFEKQILNLAKVVWQLQCEAGARMHFGRIEG